MKRLILIFTLLASISLSLGQETKLPRVLIIGDSISIMYHKTLVRELKGKADVSRIPANGEYTGFGVQKIDEWLGDKHWDVIQFNWGLWDIYGWKYVNEDRSPEAYAKRLDTLVQRLQKTGAKLIWATTTPVCPEAEVSMRDRWHTKVVISPETQKKYRDAALAVMKKHGVRVNDLYQLILPDLAKYSPKPDDVHFNKQGSEILGKQVAAEILKALKK